LPLSPSSVLKKAQNSSGALTRGHRSFLINIANAEPESNLMSCAHLSKPPTLGWKPQNLTELRKSNPRKFRKQADDCGRNRKGDPGTAAGADSHSATDRKKSPFVMVTCARASAPKENHNLLLMKADGTRENAPLSKPVRIGCAIRDAGRCSHISARCPARSVATSRKVWLVFCRQAKAMCPDDFPNAQDVLPHETSPEIYTATNRRAANQRRRVKKRRGSLHLCLPTASHTP